MRPSTRTTWVWTALSVQAVLVALSLYNCVQLLRFVVSFAAWNTTAQVLFPAIIPGAMLTIALFGLWRTRRWAWGLAVAGDGILCLQGVWFLLNYSRVVLQKPGLFALTILQFAALSIVLCRPVRDYFLGPSRRDQADAAARNVLDVVIYFAAAISTTCAVTACSVAIVRGPKSSGIEVLVFLVVAFMSGSAASFLFAVILTLVVRKFDPSQIWPWLLLGGSLAPVLLFALAFLGNLGPDLLNVVFGGPQYLLRVWWLSPIAGTATGWVCYKLYPWRRPVRE